MAVADDRPDASATDRGRCDQRSGLVHGKRFRRNVNICQECGRRARLTALERLDQLLDPGSASPVDHVEAVADPLGFTETRPYAEPPAHARAAPGLREAVLCPPCRFPGRGLDRGVGALIAGAARRRLRQRIPLPLVTASGGARKRLASGTAIAQATRAEE